MTTSPRLGVTFALALLYAGPPAPVLAQAAPGPQATVEIPATATTLEGIPSVRVDLSEAASAAAGSRHGRGREEQDEHPGEERPVFLGESGR